MSAEDLSLCSNDFNLGPIVDLMADALLLERKDIVERYNDPRFTKAIKEAEKFLRKNPTWNYIIDHDLKDGSVYLWDGNGQQYEAPYFIHHYALIKARKKLLAALKGESKLPESCYYLRG